MKRLAMIGGLLVAALVLCSCVKRGGQATPSVAVEPAAQAVQVDAAQLARDALAAARSAQPGAGGFRDVYYCPPDAKAATDVCQTGRVLAELVADIGRRVRQGGGFLVVDLGSGQASGEAGAACPGRTGLLSFRIVDKSVFPKGSVRPVIKSFCYSLGSKDKLDDCRCLANVSSQLSGLAAEARSKGQLLMILDARRYGTWETGSVDQESVSVDAPGFDIVYAIVAKPAGFDAAANLDFVSARSADAITAAPPLTITLPELGDTAAKASGPDRDSKAGPATAAPKTSAKAKPSAKGNGKKQAKPAHKPAKPAAKAVSKPATGKNAAVAKNGQNGKKTQ